MKKMYLVAGALLISGIVSAQSGKKIARKIASDKSVIVCHLNVMYNSIGNQIIDFVSSKEKIDSEYTTYEKGVYKDLTFYLRSGHGVAVLEAWDSEGKVASTFYSANDEKRMDTLRLSVRSKSEKKKLIEAVCEGVDEKPVYY